MDERTRAFYRAVGANIRRARREAGLTQPQLAERLGCSRSTVNQLERGAQRLTLDVLVDIAAYAGCRDWQELVPIRKS